MSNISTSPVASVPGGAANTGESIRTSIAVQILAGFLATTDARNTLTPAVQKTLCQEAVALADILISVLGTTL